VSHPGDNFRATEDISDGQDARLGATWSPSGFPAAVTFEPAPRFCAAMIRSVIRYGDPRLLAPNAEADPEAPELPALIADMIETCHAAPGIGLAAPQIGVNLRIAIVDLSVGASPEAVIVLVNPVLLESGGEQKEEEGCLSIPDIAERVFRPTRLRVRAADASGAVREVEGSGLLARAIAHEIDHLNRTLFVDRLRGLKRELTWKKIEKRKARGLW
jgi:peptide deformylase